MLPSDRRALQGVWLLMAALGIFFIASIVLYLLYVFFRHQSQSGVAAAPLYLPRVFIQSTAFLLCISGLLEIASRSARRDRDGVVKSCLIVATALGFLFTIVQSIGMFQLVSSMLKSGTLNNSAYSFTIVLVLLHALHVIGGMVGLFLCSVNSIRDKYDHERSFGLQFCAIYWHFLDIVWVVLIVAFYVAALVLKSP